jgi:predicted secreted protein
MAVVSGVGGSVTGGTYVTAVRSWSISFTGDALETTDMDPTNGYRTRIGGLKSISGSYSCYLDSDAMDNVDADIGNTVTLLLKLTGTAQISVAVVITDSSITASTDSAIEVEFSFEGSGAATITNA